MLISLILTIIVALHNYHHVHLDCISLLFASQTAVPVMNRWLSTASAIGLFRKSGFSIACTPGNKKHYCRPYARH